MVAAIGFVGTWVLHIGSLFIPSILSRDILWNRKKKSKESFSDFSRKMDLTFEIQRVELSHNYFMRFLHKGHSSMIIPSLTYHPINQPFIPLLSWQF